MIIFLIGLPWVALLLASFLDEREGMNGGHAAAMLLGAVIILMLVTIGFGMGKQ